jgi:hypothetical protein
VSDHALINIESAIAAAFLLILFVRSKKEASENASEPGHFLGVFTALAVAILVLNWRSLTTPFLYDDFDHIAGARNATWQSILAAFVRSDPGAIVYRPFGFLLYWLNFLAAGPSPLLFHVVNLTFHALAAFLLYILCGKLNFTRFASFAASLLYSVAGSSVESTSWIDARFDPMSTCMVLASLLCVCCYLDSGGWAWITAACVACALGTLTKETAFALPLLTACLWFFRKSKRLIAAFVTLSVVTGGLFVYRFWLLGKIGGYGGHVRPLQVLNALMLRDWTVLFFPMNWSGVATPAIWVAIISLPLAMACIARVPRRQWIGACAFTSLAAIPAYQLLLIGTDLKNSRELHLPAIGWALLWAAIFTSLPATRLRTVILSTVLITHAAMLLHNATYWIEVSREVQNICASVEKDAVVTGLPSTKNGVVFLANGFPWCAEMNGSRASVQGTPTHTWNPVTNRIEPIGPTRRTE